MQSNITNRNLIAFSFLIFSLVLFPGISQLSAKVMNGKTNQAEEHQIHAPVRLAMLPDGDLIVSDSRLEMILIVDYKSLKVKRWFGVGGKPLGVGYGRGMIYVGNETKKCIEVYNRSGKMMRKFGEQLARPSDLAIDAEADRLFAVDTLGKVVKVFRLDGTHVSNVPNIYPDTGILVNPTGVTVDPVNQKLYVSDYGEERLGIKARIQIFSYFGDNIGTISGKQGWFSARFSRPQGLYVSSGYLFMVDCFSAEIMVFDPSTGQILKVLGGYGTEPGKMRLPLDLVINSQTKDIFVTNNRLARIEVFAGGGQL